MTYRLFYVFHLMTCDSFYETHPPYNGPGDRCSRDEIAAGTATQYSILGMSTTFCGKSSHFNSNNRCDTDSFKER